MPSTAPAYTVGGITRPALIFDNAGHIILTPEAAAFAAAYGTKLLYVGLPANTPYPPVAATLSAPADSNGNTNSVLENAAVGAQVGITAQANNNGGPPVTYSLSDNAGGRFQIDANTGVVTVAAGAPLDYETAPGHAYNIIVQATDGIFTSSQTFAIGVGNVNEAPVGTDNTVAASEDTNRVFTSADFGFSDTSDNPANALAAVVINTLPAAGTLLNNGVPVVAGDSISAAAIAAGQLVFIAAPNASGAGYASFTFQVRDNGGTANGGVDLDASANTMTINVTAVNDAPTATGLTQSLTVGEDAAAIQLFTVAPVVGDIDSATVAATLTLNAAAGVLDGAGAGVLDAGVLTYTISGTAAAVNTALAAVTYDSAPNFDGTTSVGVTINDGANGPQGTNPTGSVSITVIAVNDAPTATNLTQSLTIGEDAAATTLFTLPPVTSDVDSANVTAKLTLDAAAGVLNGAGAGVLNAGMLTYAITGTAAAVNAALAAVTYDSANNFNGTTSVGVTIDDGANGPQGANPTGSISITVTAVNDAPTGTNLTQSLVIGEDAAATALFTLSPVVSDIDSANVTATLTLDATAGVLTGAGAGVLNAGLLTYTITGTPAAVTTALASVAFDSAADFNGITDVGITISDGANGPQGSNPIGTGTVTINAVNDAPTATNLTQSLSVGEDGAAATLFTLAPVVADIDSSNVTATLKLNSSAGVLTGAGTGALAAGILTYTITGTAADVNSALATVTYDSADNFNGATSVGVTIDDGAAGPQGTNPTGTISITVNAVNDAPTATNLTQSLTINEDAAATTLFTLPPVAADIDSANVTATLTLDAATGVLTGASAGVLNAGILTYTITGTLASVNAALAAVTYDSAPNFFGSTSVGFTIGDGANGPQGSNPTGSVSITVNAVNDAPTLAATANNPSYVPAVDLFSGVSASTVESGQLITQVVLTVSNVFGNDEILNIDGDNVFLRDGTVSDFPTATLGVSYSVAVSGNTATITITSPGLSGAETGTLVDELTYLNLLVAPGELPRVVTIVSLTDGGGNLLGGSDTGTPGIASTVNFNVAPTIDVDGTINYTENDGRTVIDSSIAITDPDNASMTGATVAITTGFDNTQDVLNFTPVGAITGSYNASTGVLTLSGIDTKANYELALESVTYQNISDDPSTAQRTVSYAVSDGSAGSAAATATINVTAVNDEPTLTATGLNPTYIESGPLQDIFSNVVVSTVEPGQTLDELVFTVAGIGSNDYMRIDTTYIGLSDGFSVVGTSDNGMTVSVAVAAGIATVTVSKVGGISASAMQTLIDNMLFLSDDNDPATNRVFTITSLRDDGLNGGGDDNINSTLNIQSTITIAPVNDEPQLSASPTGNGNLTFTETSAPGFPGSGAVDLFLTPAFVSPIEAGQTFTQVVLTVTDVADTTEYLTIGATAVDLVNGNSEAVTVGGAAGTAIVSITGGVATVTVTPTTTFDAANVSALVDSLAYSNDDNSPTATTRTISVSSITDSGANGGVNGDDNTGNPNVSNVVTVVATNDGPVAVNDTFTGVNGAITNTALVVDGPTAGTADPAGVQKVITGNILANDADADGGPLSVVGGVFSTAQGGTVTLDTDGGFVYVPKPNSDGTVDTNDSFTYTVTDGNSAGQNGTATATVTINFVPNSTVWYVDGSYTGANGASDGSSLRPFTDFTQLNGAGGAGDVDAAGDTIFVYDGTYTGNLELEAGQSLFGERHGLEVPDGSGGAGTTTLLAADVGAGLTQINGTITASSNNSIQAISWGSSAGVSLTGINVGNLHVNDANAASAGSINNTTGGAVSINGSTAGMNMQFANVSSGAGTAGISLTNALGTFNATGGTLSGHTGSEFFVNGGNGTVSYAGNVSDGAGSSSIAIFNRSGGTVTLSGNINDGADAGGTIDVFSNASGTVNFTGANKTLNTGSSDGVALLGNGTMQVNFTNGGLNINTTGGTGFSASSGGTVTVTGSGNSITTTTSGQVLDWNNISIGSSGVTFASLNHTGTTGTTAVNLNNVDGSGNTFNGGTVNIAGTATFEGIFVANSNATFNFGTTTVTGAGDEGIELFGDNGAITFSSVVINGSGGNGIEITNAVNAVSVNGGSIGATDDPAAGAKGIDINGGSANITIDATINKTSAGRVVEISGRTGGTVDFNGLITSNGGGGIDLTGNTGGTVRFDGGMNLSTGGNVAFSSSGGSTGATLIVTDPAGATANILNTTTATALNVVNTTIGAEDMTFQSISANGGANGIVLNNTGSSGGLTVTGNGATNGTGDGTGGTIQNIGTRGIVLINTADVSINNVNFTNANTANGTSADLDISASNAAIYMSGVAGAAFNNININGTADNGITGLNVSNFTLANSTITQAGNAANESGIEFSNLSGISAITNSDISFSETNSVDIVNTGVNLTLTVTGSTFRDTQTVSSGGAASSLGEGGIQFRSFSSGAAPTTNLIIDDNDFLNLRTQAIQVIGEDNSIVNVNVTDSRIDALADVAGTPSSADATHIGAGIDINGNDTATVNFNVYRNTIDSRGGAAINITSFLDSEVQGRIYDNTVTAEAGVGAVGPSGNAGGSGIRVVAQETSHTIVDVMNNTITMGSLNNSSAIDLIARIQNARLDVTLNNNTINSEPSAIAAINLQSGSSAQPPEAPETNQIYANILNNDIAAGGAANVLRLRVSAYDAAANPRIFLTGFVEGGAGIEDDAIATWNANGNTPAASAATIAVSLSGDAVGPSAGTALTPTNPLPTTLLAASGGIQALSPTPGETHLTQAQLDSVVAAAIAQWANSGATSSQLAALAATTFTVANLSGNAIGLHTGSVTIIDTDAAGHGWFVDSTPADNFEFADTAGTGLSATPTSAAAGHLDLLTAVMHEMGHELGLDHSAVDAHDLMFSSLVDGERRLPSAADVAQANAGPVQAQASAQASGLPVTHGTAGNDTLDAGIGGKILFGEAGADQFVFANVPASTPSTHVADYSFVQGDSFDFSALTSAFHGSGMNDGQIVRAVEDASGAFATLQVNSANPAWGTKFGPTWTNVAQIDGAHAGDDVGVLIDGHVGVHLAHLHVGLLA